MADANVEAVVASSPCAMVCLHPDLTWGGGLVSRHDRLPRLEMLQIAQWVHNSKSSGGVQRAGSVAGEDNRVLPSLAP